LCRNRKLNLAALRPIRNSTRKFLVLSRSKGQKNQPLEGLDIAYKWKRNSQKLKVKDAWFIRTDLCSLPVAIPYGIASLHAAYKKRMGIEEMFRDCKTGGYNIEGTSLREDRLIKIILLMMLAYSLAIFQGIEFRKNRCKNMYTA
jgi:hypothetical protein